MQYRHTRKQNNKKHTQNNMFVQFAHFNFIQSREQTKYGFQTGLFLHPAVICNILK